MKFAIILTFLLSCFICDAQNKIGCLLTYYPLDGNANDLGDGAHDGILNGPTPTQDRFGQANGALHFDGINDFIHIPTFAGLDNLSNQVTLSAWVKPVSQYYNTVLAKGSAEILMDFAIYLRPGIIFKDVVVDFPPAQNYWGRLLPFSNVPENQWSHYVSTYSASTGKIYIYIDGVIVHQSTAQGLINPGLEDLRIGKRISTIDAEHFWGDIDDVRIYCRALNQFEVLDLYNFNGLTSTSSVETKSDFTIGPNPSTGMISINGDQELLASNQTLEIFNCLGQTLYHNPLTNFPHQIDLSTLGEKGLYFLRFKNENGKVVDVQKVMLQ